MKASNNHSSTLSYNNSFIEYTAMTNHQKRDNQRRRNIIVLMLKYFEDMGYINSIQALEIDSTITMDKWKVADNMDIYYIIKEFEEYYELKYNRLPLMVKKVKETLNSSRYCLSSFCYFHRKTWIATTPKP